MTAKFAKVGEIADRYRVSVDAVYLWIRQGKIPADCVIRIAGTVRVDEDLGGHPKPAIDGHLKTGQRRKHSGH
jgi:hypothetical protein